MASSMTWFWHNTRECWSKYVLMWFSLMTSTWFVSQCEWYIVLFFPSNKILFSYRFILFAKGFNEATRKAPLYFFSFNEYFNRQWENHPIWTAQEGVLIHIVLIQTYIYLTTESLRVPEDSIPNRSINRRTNNFFEEK